MVTSKVIVLRAVKHGESDLIVRVIESTGAKLGLFAKGAMRSQKRFSGGLLEPTHALLIDHAPRSEGGLSRLIDARLIESFPLLRKDYDRLKFALEMMSLVDRTSMEGSTDMPQIFSLVGHSLKALQVVSDPKRLRLLFLIKFLTIHGVWPADPDTGSWMSLPVAKCDLLRIEDNRIRDIETRVADCLRSYLPGG